MLQPNQSYNVTVIAANLTESNSGTSGIALTFECEEGTIPHTIWLTDKTKDFAKKDLETLGVSAEQLKSQPFWQSVGTFLVGRDCNITTFEEEYKGKKKLKVQWINAKKVRGSGAITARAARFFGGTAVEVADEDVPF